MPRGRTMRGLRPASCTRASVCGRWSSTAARPVAGCQRCLVRQRFASTGALRRWSSGGRRIGMARIRTGGSRGADALRGRRERADGAHDGTAEADRVSGARLHTRPVDTGRFAGGRPAAGVAPGREPPVRVGPARACRAIRRGRCAAPGRTVSGGCADGHAGIRDRDQGSGTGDQGSAIRDQRIRDQGSGSRGGGRRRSDEWPHGLEWLAPGARRGNSNNWVISGRRTASGRPLLANDPHLQVELPGVLVRTPPRGRRAERRRRLHPRHAVRRPRSQRGDRVGHDQHGRGRAGPVRRAGRRRRGGAISIAGSGCRCR